MSASLTSHMEIDMAKFAGSSTVRHLFARAGSPHISGEGVYAVELNTIGSFEVENYELRANDFRGFFASPPIAFGPKVRDLMFTIDGVAFGCPH